MDQSDQNTLNKRRLVPEERGRRIVQLLRESGSVTGVALQEEFGTSPMTVRRDLEALERAGKAKRTHGGAVLPGVGTHEDSFQKRLEDVVGAKRRLARAAVGLLQSGETVFVDGSTTAYYVARQIFADSVRVTLLTNLAPIMDLFRVNEAPNVELVCMGGSLRKLTLSFVGPHAVRTIKSHFANKAVLSVKGITPEGYLTDPDPLEAEVKRAMIEHSAEPILLVDESKFEQRSLNVISHVSELSRVLVADATEARIEALSREGVEAHLV